MKSTIELELELSNAKLKKMTETVKRLETKLKDVNEKLSLAKEGKSDADYDLSVFKEKYNTLTKLISNAVITINKLKAELGA